jgi:hypothetical protein
LWLDKHKGVVRAKTAVGIYPSLRESEEATMKALSKEQGEELKARLRHRKPWEHASTKLGASFLAGRSLFNSSNAATGRALKRWRQASYPDALNAPDVTAGATPSSRLRASRSGTEPGPS